MSLPAALADAVGAALGAAIVATRPVGGGSIHRAARLELDDGRSVFLKHNPDAAPGAFATEAADLRWLAEARAVRTPEVLAVGTDVGAPFLALEWIASGTAAQSSEDVDARSGSSAERLGRGLARLHRFGAPAFGLDRDNLIGPLPQENTPVDDWPAFYARRRLLPMTRMAVDRGALSSSAAAGVERLAGRLEDLCGPPEPPARLHGDLWGGNAILGAAGGPVVLDPAVYGGHREMDLAMMRLFGGFPPAVVAAYDEEHPLADGHEDRVELFQLYPLLVHVVLFGGSYSASAERVVRRYAGSGGP